jgi:SPP1 family predicted phage head-tail adaptor
MNSGRLRHRIKFQEETTTLAADGSSVRAWSDFYSCWADVRNRKQSEQLQADAPVVKSSHSVRVRYNPGLITSMRILWGSRIFQVDGITADRTDAKFQLIDATEITNG